MCSRRQGFAAISRDAAKLALQRRVVVFRAARRALVTREGTLALSVLDALQGAYTKHFRTIAHCLITELRTPGFPAAPRIIELRPLPCDAFSFEDSFPGRGLFWPGFWAPGDWPDFDGR